MGATSPSPTLPDFRLQRIRISNYRRIGNADVAIPEGKNLVVLVGRNGSGKSSVMYSIYHALRKGTHDTKVAFKLDANEDELSGVGVVHSSEIATGKNAYAIMTDWISNDAKYSFARAARQVDIPFAPSHLSFELPPEFVQSLSQGWSTEKWLPRPPQGFDPIARIVALFRPPDRGEVPIYERTPDKFANPDVTAKWDETRTFPIRVGSFGVDLERFMLQMHSEMGRRVSTGTWFHNKWNSVYTSLTGETWRPEISGWPFLQIGPEGLGSMSLLSSGELDILVTTALILAQKVAIVRRFPRIGWDPQAGPNGIVLIDEVDSHLHPQWQQQVVPLLVNTFPEIMFVISTHSPFVVRSLPKDKSIVVRLPDGETFEDDFGRWDIEEILAILFDVPPRWLPEIENKLKEFERAAGDDGRAEDAFRLYQDLTRHGGAALNSEARKLLVLHGSDHLQRLVEKADNSHASEV